MRFFWPNKKLCSPILATLCTAFVCLVVRRDIVADEAKFEFFEQKIRPVLVEHCYECHSADAGEVKAGLRLDHAEGILSGGDSGPAIDLSLPEESLIVKALRYDEDFYQMPPKAKLDDQVAADFQQWISQGAPDPRTATTSTTREPPPADHNQQLRDSHWAFQLPQVASLDDQPPSDWIRNGLDRFVLAQLRRDQIEPSATANDDTLVRRLYLDLIGIPPTFEQIQQVRLGGAESYDALVDQLLNSPQLGERWARLWMDVARYSDTKGYVFTEDRAYADAYQYREWLIQAFNQDLPFDQFVFQQLSADRSEFADDPDELAAMGFLTLGRRFLNNKHDIIDDRIDVVTRGLLGLTVTCARCHDHKYDPIPIADYYSLYGVFDSSREPNDPPSRLRMVDDANPKDAPIFLRGNSSNPGEVVPRRFLLAIAGKDRPAFQDGSGRKELAEAIASKENPLTAESS
ncbi:MAG: DUF1549 domain-containing protein [Pirellulaceae bacterium]